MELTKEQWEGIHHGITDVYFDHVEDGYDSLSADYLKDIFYLERFIGESFEANGNEPHFVTREEGKALKRCFIRLVKHYIDSELSEDLGSSPDEFEDCAEAMRSLCIFFGVDRYLNV